MITEEQINNMTKEQAIDALFGLSIELIGIYNKRCRLKGEKRSRQGFCDYMVEHGCDTELSDVLADFYERYNQAIQAA